MKKICFVVTISETFKCFFMQMAEYLHKEGNYDIFFICNSNTEFENSIPNYIHFIPVKMERGISLGGIKAIFEMKKIFKENKFDIVQYSTPNASFYASIASKLARIKIRNYHLMGLRYLGSSGAIKFFLKTLEKISCAFSTHIECVSNSNLELAVRDGLFKREKATVVWNGSTGGVDLNRFDYRMRQQYKSIIRNKLEIREDEFVFSFVGRITRDKGINEILSAFFELENRCKLLLIGDDEGIETLNRELWEKAIQNDDIIILQSVNDIEKYYCAADVLLLPSYREGFGMVIAEAAAMGTPAIVSNIPGPIDVVEPDKTAILVNAKDINALRDAMNFVLCSKSRINEMSENCVEHIKKNFDSKALCKYILERKDKLISFE